jgi:hypothetical protein
MDFFDNSGVMTENTEGDKKNLVKIKQSKQKDQVLLALFS